MSKSKRIPQKSKSERDRIKWNAEDLMENMAPNLGKESRRKRRENQRANTIDKYGGEWL